MNGLGLLVFGVTYVLICARRLRFIGLDRPAAALAGAVAFVALGLLDADQALSSVDGATLLLLFAVMGMGAFLGVDGVFDALEGRLLLVARTPRGLLAAIVWGAGLMSALITNDAVCVLGTPLVVRLVKKHKLSAAPHLLALATAANTGSVATLVGNPQNMLCGLLGGLAYRDYLVTMAPMAVAALAVNHGILLLAFRRDLAVERLGPPEPVVPISGRARTTLLVIASTAIAYTLGAHLSWTAAAGLVGLMILHRRDTQQIWERIEWSLLVFFAALFVVVAGLSRTGAPAAFFGEFPLRAVADGSRGLPALSAVFLLGSNLVSNVPFILLVKDQIATLPDPKVAWELLAVCSTFAGNLTLVGSAANLIVAEGAQEVGSFGFWEHLRVGLPVALVTTSIGTAWLWLVRFVL